MATVDVQALTYQDVKTLHINSDVDENLLAYHHTLGLGINQAASGAHTHDGKNSLRIKFADIEGGWMNVDGGEPWTIYTPIPRLDGGSI